MEDFKFRGPGGVVWTHRVQVLSVCQSVDDNLLYRDEDCYQTYLKDTSARLLGKKILDTASVLKKRDAPFGGTVYDWRVAVVMPDSDQNYFADQMDAVREEGRRAGLAEARELLSRKIRTEDDYFTRRVLERIALSLGV